MIASPYLTSAEAATFVRAPSVKAFLAWARVHHVGGLRRGKQLLWLPECLMDAINPVAVRTRPKRVAGGNSWTR